MNETIHTTASQMNGPASAEPKTTAHPGSPYRQAEFRELDVNPSVPPSRSEENRLSAQSAKILALFRSRFPNGTVTTLEMAAISRQYNVRLWEIRRYLVRRGFCIDCIRRGPHGNHFYRVLPQARSKFFRKHRAQFALEGLI